MLIKNNLYLYFIVHFFHRALREKRLFLEVLSVT